jgi:signal transduction histidine kinase/DNA-binding response OmpR family regulator
MNKANKTLITELALTVLVVFAMAMASYLFMRTVVEENLVRHADSVLSATEEHIATSLDDFELSLNGFADEIRARVMRGDSVEAVKDYLAHLTSCLLMTGERMSEIRDFFVYLEDLPDSPVFLSGSDTPVSPEFDPTARAWYTLALDADGGIAQTVPEVIDASETRFIYSKCIIGGDGQRLGVVGLNAKIDMIGQSVVATALNQGGYGMLLNQSGMVLFHPNADFRGIDMRDPAIPVSRYADAIGRGDVVAQPVISYMGEDAVLFFHTIDNGWHLGLVTPKDRYYESTSKMIWIIIALAALFAAALVGILIRVDLSRRKADEESRQKSMFLANMSHEIRTPINAIVGMTAIGKTVASTERKDYCFTKIDDASRHLLGVINDILDMSKIEANRIELSPTDFNFEKMLQQVVNVINFRVDEKHQKLSVYIDSKIPKVLYADDQRYSQVLTNLLSNAVKFSPENSEIRLITQLKAENNGVYTIQIEVADEGIGLSPEQQLRIFETFQQAESSTTRAYGGTGLGLSISKSIVELMGGEIWVRSERGKGSTFTFTVNATLGDSTRHGFADEDIDWGNIRILTVDDDRDILEYFHDVINRFGANCEIASGADEALHLVDENGDYNIYFIDLRMPGVDGIALTKEIRAKEKDPGHSIVIMISSADLSTMEDEARKAGVDRFLLKPIFPSAIADVINDCIGIAVEKAQAVPADISGIFKGKRILFAEDVEINYEIVQSLLEPTLIEMECAVNGAEAVQMFMRNPDKYDLIFMDVQMPEMDGYEATRQIRSLNVPRAKEIPIVAMTANVFKEDVEKCLAAGMNAHLGKPLDIDAMLGVLMRYVGRGGVN